MSSEAERTRISWPGPLGWAGLLIATLLLCYPLWLSRPSLPWGSDTMFTSQSAHAFAQSLDEGVLYPRWVADSNRGFGSPTFIFYPPIAYYAAALGAKLFGDVIDGMRLVFIVAGFLSGLSFFLAFRESSSELGATIGAALYVIAPYHMLDFYYRFAFAEYFAFIWFPLLFLFSRRLMERPTWAGAVGLAASYAGLVLTHLVTAYMVLVVLGPYVLLRLVVSRRWLNLAPLAGAGVLALLCSAVYVVPMLAQRDQVHLDWIRESHYGGYQRNFAYRNEIDFGYQRAPIKPFVNRSASTQGALALAGVGLLAWQLLRSRKVGPRSKMDPLPIESAAQATLCAWTFFLQIPLSAPLWSGVPELANVQFPWRFGAFQALSACALAACVLRGEPRSRKADKHRETWWHWAPLAVILVSALPMISASYQVQGQAFMTYDRKKAAQASVRSRVMYEYIPAGVDHWREFEKVPPVLGRRDSQARLVGGGDVQVERWENHSRRVSVSTSSPNKLQLRTFAYPGWKARLDGAPVPVQTHGKLRAIEIDVPPGQHTVEVVFGSTPDRVAGAMLSVLGLVGLALMASLGLRGRSRTGP